MRYDKTDKADKPRDRDRRARKERGYRDQEEPEDLSAKSEGICRFVTEHEYIHPRRQEGAYEDPDCGVGKDHTEALPAHTVESAYEESRGISERFGEKGLDYIVECSEQSRDRHARQYHFYRRNTFLICQRIYEHRGDECSEDRAYRKQVRIRGKNDERKVSHEARTARHADS